VILDQSLTGIGQGYHTTIRDFGASLSGIYQGYHTMMRDFGAKFIRNMLGLPHDDEWLWSKVFQEYVRATT
jgi:hypothetical protein